MDIAITEITLRRLVNYEAVIKRHYLGAQKRQWKVMTLDAMQGFEKARAQVQRVSCAVAYAGYLWKVQEGLAERRSVYGEPFLSRALVELMAELDIPVRSPRVEAG